MLDNLHMLEIIISHVYHTSDQRYGISLSLSLLWQSWHILLVLDVMECIPWCFFSHELSSREPWWEFVSYLTSNFTVTLIRGELLISESDYAIQIDIKLPTDNSPGIDLESEGGLKLCSQHWSLTWNEVWRNSGDDHSLSETHSSRKPSESPTLAISHILVSTLFAELSR